MAAASSFSEEQFLCSICLDVFTAPVTLPCGHNFCKSCITQAWEVNGKYQCPMCKELLAERPGLRVNTVLSEMADLFKKKNSDVEQKQVQGGDVPCDMCTGTKLKALKSCLLCLASYCEAHLELHHRIPGLKNHELIDPVKNLEDRMCKKHERPLKVFCQTDQSYLCQLCIGTEHKRHRHTPLKKQYKLQRAVLESNQACTQQMILKRRLKILQVKHSVKFSKEDADREIAASVQVCTDLIQCVERSLAQLIDLIDEKHKTTEKQAEAVIKELEEEISELMKRKAELEQFSHTKDHLTFLQSFKSLNAAPDPKDWTEVRVHTSYEGTVRRAVAQLQETMSKETRRLCADAELRRVQRYAVDVTLDPDTAHPALILSENNKHVSCGDVKKNLPDNPERFSAIPCVLGKQSFTSGRFYYEVQVKAKTRWNLGVARESINRKGQVPFSPLTGFWIIWLNNEYRALDGTGVCLSLKSQPQKVGVFVDYEEGLVSFYDVDTAALIYSFAGCKFTETVFPVFGPGINDGGKNSAPLVISPVNHTD